MHCSFSGSKFTGDQHTMSRKHSKELVGDLLKELKQIFDNDTEVFLEDVKLLQQLNTQESLKLVKLQSKLKVMVDDSEKIKQASKLSVRFFVSY